MANRMINALATTSPAYPVAYHRSQDRVSSHFTMSKNIPITSMAKHGPKIVPHPVLLYRGPGWNAVNGCRYHSQHAQQHHRPMHLRSPLIPHAGDHAAPGDWLSPACTTTDQCVVANTPGCPGNSDGCSRGDIPGSCVKFCRHKADFSARTTPIEGRICSMSAPPIWSWTFTRAMT
jgi:hypothetical protein